MGSDINELTHDFLDCPLDVEHPNGLGPAGYLVRRLVKYLELLEEAFVGSVLV